MPDIVTKDISYILSKITEKDERYDTPKFALLLGAGCSISSNIPSGSKVIEICKKFSFVDNDVDGYTLDKAEKYNHLIYIQKVDKFIEERDSKFQEFVSNKEKEFFEKLTDQEIFEKIPDNILKRYQATYSNDFKEKLVLDYKDKIFNDSLYGNWLEEFNSDPRERQKLIESIIENQKVSGEYILFANLIHQNLIQNIFTTNFDDLIYESIVTYANDKARVYAHNEIAQYITLGSKKPNVIKLHGDYLFENIMNSNKETAKLAENMGKKMKEVLNSLDLIVVGYNGSDSSIMKVLEEIKIHRKYSLIWCAKDISDLNWRVKNILETTENSFFVNIDDFATLVFKLWSIKKLPNVNLDELGKQKQKELSEYLDKFNTDIQKNNSISVNEKEAFSDLLKASEFFNLALKEKDKKKKIELYTESLKYNRKSKESFLNRGHAKYKLGQYQDSIDDYSQALKIDNNYVLALLNISDPLEALGKSTVALDFVNRALEIEPSNSDAIGAKGCLLFKAQKKEEGLELINNQIKIAPESPSGYLNRALVMMETGELDKAAEDYRILSEMFIDEENLPVYFNNMAVYYRRRKDPENAKKMIVQAEEKNLELSLLNGTLALIYADMGDTTNFYDQLEIAFEKGCPVWNYLDDPAFEKYKNETRLKDLLKKYQPI
jgi:tetratricopeptide (TPR) repeat protein